MHGLPPQLGEVLRCTVKAGSQFVSGTRDRFNCQNADLSSCNTVDLGVVLSPDNL